MDRILYGRPVGIIVVNRSIIQSVIRIYWEFAMDKVVNLRL